MKIYDEYIIGKWECITSEFYVAVKNWDSLFL